MTDRERLIELIVDKENEVAQEYPYTTDTFRIRNVADYLLANGVIVPPCKVGDTVYIIDTLVDNDKCSGCEYYYEGGFGDHPGCDKTRYGFRSIECIEIKEHIVEFGDILWWLYKNDFNRFVFFTYEDAVKALKENGDKYNGCEW